MNSDGDTYKSVLKWMSTLLTDNTVLEEAYEERFVYCDVCGYDWDLEDYPNGCPSH